MTREVVNDKWLRRMASRCRSAMRGSGVILLYHRIAAPESDPMLLSVSGDNFERHLEVIRARATPIPLQEMVERMKSGASLKGCVAVTFDDGYSDNLYSAMPILVQTDVPATVFVVPPPSNGVARFWWDELEAMVLRSPTLPPSFQMETGGRTTDWRLDGVTDSFKRASDSDWNVTSEGRRSTRQALYVWLHESMMEMRHDERERQLERLAAWVGRSRCSLDTPRGMDETELRQLALGDLIEVGAHTLAHPVLSLESALSQRNQIRGAKDRTEEILGTRVQGFAYPFGGAAHYTSETILHVRDAGFSYSCANIASRVNRQNDPYQLPRFLVRDWDSVVFEEFLHGVL